MELHLWGITCHVGSECGLILDASEHNPP